MLSYGINAAFPLIDKPLILEILRNAELFS